MFYNIKGKMTDGRTISGIISGGNPVEACAGFITKNSLDATALSTVKLSAIDESVTAKVRAPKKKKDATNATGSTPAAPATPATNARKR